MDGRHAVQVFVDGADQHLPPEAVDGVRRLALLQQPVEHADAVQILAPRAFPAQGQEGAGDGEFVGGAEALHSQERPGEVERGGQPSALQHRDPPARFDEIELAIEGDAFADPEPLVEIQQIDAAAQQHVLAIVDGLGDLFAARGDCVGGSAATQVGASFVEIDFPTVAPQGRRRREPCQSATGNQHFRHLRVVSQTAGIPTFRLDTKAALVTLKYKRNSCPPLHPRFRSTVYTSWAAACQDKSVRLPP